MKHRYNCQNTEAEAIHVTEEPRSGKNRARTYHLLALESSIVLCTCMPSKEENFPVAPARKSGNPGEIWLAVRNFQGPAPAAERSPRAAVSFEVFYLAGGEVERWEVEVKESSSRFGTTKKWTRLDPLGTDGGIILAQWRGCQGHNFL